MEAAGAGSGEPAPRLEAPGSAEDRLFLVKGVVRRGCRGEPARGPRLRWRGILPRSAWEPWAWVGPGVSRWSGGPGWGRPWAGLGQRAVPSGLRFPQPLCCPFSSSHGVFPPRGRGAGTPRPLLYAWEPFLRMISGARGREVTRGSQPLSFTLGKSCLAIVSGISEVLKM